MENNYNFTGAMTEKPVLHDIRILDFSWVLAGPYATRLLADFGAEVIKVQPLLPEASDRFSQGYYNTWNRNKLGITLNMGRPEGRDIARKLVKLSDAVVENFSPRVMTNWGLDYPALRELKPDIILVSLSLMGHTGPWGDYVGFGPTAQAFSGITCLTSYPHHPPSGIGYSYSDHVAGLYASLALLDALEHRRSTGEGQFIDLSQTEVMVSLLPDAIRGFTQSGREPQPEGNSSIQAAPHGVYRCQEEDRWCAVSASTEEEWTGLKKALGNPLWAEEARFSTLTLRLQHAEALDSLIQGWTEKLPAEEVMERLQKEGVPAGAVRNAADLANDPQLRARGFFLELDHPVLGRTLADANPIRLSGSPAKYRRAAPLPGQDNEYVYCQLLGLSQDEINRLRMESII